LPPRHRCKSDREWRTGASVAAAAAVTNERRWRGAWAVGASSDGATCRCCFCWALQPAKGCKAVESAVAMVLLRMSASQLSLQPAAIVGSQRIDKYRKDYRKYRTYGVLPMLQRTPLGPCPSSSVATHFDRAQNTIARQIGLLSQFTLFAAWSVAHDAARLPRQRQTSSSGSGDQPCATTSSPPCRQPEWRPQPLGRYPHSTWAGPSVQASAWHCCSC
jgi:hypothetical protein